jgi:hypothetical protein
MPDGHVTRAGRNWNSDRPEEHAGRARRNLGLSGLLTLNLPFRNHFLFVIVGGHSAFDESQKISFRDSHFASHAANQSVSNFGRAEAQSRTNRSLFSVQVKPKHHMMLGVFSREALMSEGVLDLARVLGHAPLI